MNDNDKYIVDIAREKVYQNQYDDYHDTFAKWRTAENNPYGYSFVHDTREHTYVDGEGYYHKSAEAAEKSALSKCLGLLGITLLIMTLLDAVSGLVFYEVFQDPAVDEIYFSQVHVHKDVSPLMALFFGGMSLVKNLVGLWIFLHFTKIPTKVAIPMPKDSKILKSGLFLMLTIMVFGRVCNFIITHNIPKIGFVVSLTANVNWREKSWVTYGACDTIPTKYLSIEDGQVHDFDAKWADPSNADYAKWLPILRNETNGAVAKNRRQVEPSYNPVLCINVNVTKQFKNFDVSFFANNMFRSTPLQSLVKSPGDKVRRNSNVFFFGLQLTARIK